MSPSVRPRSLDDALHLVGSALARVQDDPDGAERDARRAHDAVCSMAADVRLEMHGSPEATHAIEVATKVGEIMSEVRMAAAMKRHRARRLARVR